MIERTYLLLRSSLQSSKKRGRGDICGYTETCTRIKDETNEAITKEESRQQLEKKQIEEKAEYDRIVSKKHIAQFIQLMTSKNANKDKLYYYSYTNDASLYNGIYKHWPKKGKLIGEGWIIRPPYDYTEPYSDYATGIPGTFLLCNGQLCIYDNFHQRGGFFSSEMDFLGGRFEQSRDSNMFAGDDINNILAEVVIRYGLV